MNVLGFDIYRSLTLGKQLQPHRVSSRPCRRSAILSMVRRANLFHLFVNCSALIIQCTAEHEWKQSDITIIDRHNISQIYPVAGATTTDSIEI